MRYKKRIISAVMAVMCCASLLSGCGNDESKNTSSTIVKEQTKQNVKPEIPKTQYDLVASGKSDYYILVPEQATENELFASSELQLFFKEATGFELPILTEGAADLSGSYLSVGNTKASQDAGVTPTYEELKNSGFVLKTIEDDCYIKGYNDFGTRNGIYEWLYYCFDYECYAEDCIALTETADMKLPAFEVSTKPSFDYRMSTGAVLWNTVLSYRMRFNLNEEIFVTGNACHNSYEIISPYVYNWTDEKYAEWYSDTLFKNREQGNDVIPAQLCYSNADMRAEYIKNLKTILENSEVPLMILGQEDGNDWCTCEACTASFDKYKTNAATLIQFANHVQEEISNWYATEHPEKEPIKLYIFAYGPTLNAPVKYDDEAGTYVPIDDNVKLNEKLGIFFGTSAGSIYPYTSEVNYEKRQTLEAWNALTDDIGSWTYSTYPLRAFLMYDNFEIIQENYKFFLDNGVVLMKDQTDNWNDDKSTAWSHAKYYVISKLMWNVDLNMEELLDDFFANYFDLAGDTMRELFDEERQWIRYAHTQLGMPGEMASEHLSTDYWSYPMIADAMERIDEAYEEIAVYQDSDPEHHARLHDRITLESLQYRYLLIELYSAQFEANELLHMKYAFKEDVERLGVKTWRENFEIQDVWLSWGIN